MPFVNKSNTKNEGNPLPLQDIFIGRVEELEYFESQILRLEIPDHNILSISGDGGIGKSTLLERYNRLAEGHEFREFCVVVQVDENQITSTSIMKRFAEQLVSLGHSMPEFNKALTLYEETLRKLQAEREVGREAFIRKVSELSTSVVDDLPVVGSLLKEGAKSATDYVLTTRRTRQLIRDAERLEDPLGNLTAAFIKDLNHIAETPSNKNRRYHRIVLLFDTFEQLGLEATPWLLDHLLPQEVNCQIVLVMAGRDPLWRIGDRTSGWFEHRDSVKQFFLKTFTLKETTQYLASSNITDQTEINRMHDLSGGLPFFLDLLVSSPEEQANPTRDVVKRFLRWIPEKEEYKRRLAIDAAFFLKPFDQDDLEAFDYLPTGQAAELYDWLTGLTFVRRNPIDGKYRYHDLARELFTRELYQRSQREYCRTVQALVAYYQQKLAQIEQNGGAEVKKSNEWQELALTLLQQLLHLPEENKRLNALELCLDIFRNSKTYVELITRLQTLSQEKADTQVPAASRQLSGQLAQYIECEHGTPEFLTSADYLIGQAKRVASFSSNSLAKLYASRGETHRMMENYQAVLLDFDHAIKLNPNSSSVYTSRGETHRMMKNYQAALLDLDHAIELDPNSSLAYAHRGETHRMMENYQAALLDFDHAIELGLKYIGVYASRGVTHRLMKNYQAALLDFDHAIELDPNSSSVYTSRGVTHRLMKNYQAALLDFDHAIELDPNSSLAYAHRGETHRMMKNYQAALLDLDHAIELDHKYSWAYASRGETHRQMKNYQTALLDLDRTIELDPNSSWAYASRGVTHRQMKNYQTALLDLDRAIELDPNSSWAYASRGVTHLFLNDLNLGYVDLELALKLDSKHAWYGLVLVWINWMQEPTKHPDPSYLESLTCHDPTDYNSVVCTGLAYLLRGDLQSARAELGRALEQKNTDYEAPFWQGYIYAGEGCTEEAITAIKLSLANGLPPILLKPLQWLENNPTFYEEQVLPLLAR